MLAMPTPPSTPSDELKERIREFVQDLNMGQVYTVNKEGFPTGRTIGANLNDDWSVDLMQAKDNGRVTQVRRHPQMAIEWNDGGRSGNLNIPKAVFLRGIGETFEGDRLVMAYNKRMDRMEKRGSTRPRLPEAQVREELVGIHVRPVLVRAEGFGDYAEVFVWAP